MNDYDREFTFYISTGLSTDGQQQNAPTIQDLKQQLMSSKDADKIKGMKQLLLWTVNPSGVTTSYDSLFMIVIRYVAPSRDHELGKLVQLYWETLNEIDESSKSSEIILVSQFIRNNLTHPNEYVRGSSLRSLARMRSITIFQTVEECVFQNIVHPHPFVRRNACMCVRALALKHGPALMKESISHLKDLAMSEVNVSVQRAAILALAAVDPKAAIQLFLISPRRKSTLAEGADNSSTDTDGEGVELRDSSMLGETCQLAVLELVKRCYVLLYETFPPTEQSQEVSEIIDRSDLIRWLSRLLESNPGDAVSLEAGKTLAFISDYDPQVCQLSCKALSRVILQRKDINIRLAVIENIHEIVKRCPLALKNHLAVDLLRSISSPSIELREKALICSLPALTNRTVQDAINLINSELIKTMSCNRSALTAGATQTGPGLAPAVRTNTHMIDIQRQMIKATRYLCTKFPDLVPNVIEFLLDFLSEPDGSVEVALLVRELTVTHSDLRPKIISRLIESLGDITLAKSLRMAIWVCGEYIESLSVAKEFIAALFIALGPLPFPKGGAPAVGIGSTDDTAREETVMVRTIILPDGSYGSENIISTKSELEGSKAGRVTGLRQAIVQNDDTLLAAIISVAIRKVLTRVLSRSSENSDPLKLEALNEGLLIVSSLLKLYDEKCGPTSDVVGRIRPQLMVLYNAVRGKMPRAIGSKDQEKRLKKVIAMEREAALYEDEMSSTDWSDGLGSSKTERLKGCDIDDILSFRCMTGSDSYHVRGAEPADGETSALDFYRCPINAVRGVKSKDHGMGSGSLASLLGPTRAVELSGISDPLKIEVVTQFNHVDLILEFSVRNQTAELAMAEDRAGCGYDKGGNVLRNVKIHLGCQGDIRILELPDQFDVNPGEEKLVYGSLRIESTENGVVYGYCSYERERRNRGTDLNTGMKEYLNLNELRIDYLDCIEGRSLIGDTSFRKLWAEFEWENKISISVNALSVFQFLRILLKNTKMNIVNFFHQSASQTPALPDFADTDLEVENYFELLKECPGLQKMAKSRIFALNLCSRSKFGEEALVNLSLEKVEDSKLVGNVRIRSRTQGIALSLGDRIAAAASAPLDNSQLLPTAHPIAAA